MIHLQNSKSLIFSRYNKFLHSYFNYWKKSNTITSCASFFSTLRSHEDDDDTSYSLQRNPFFPHLFEPLNLGPNIGNLPNRFIMGSMHTGLEGNSIPNVLNTLLKNKHDPRDLSSMAEFFIERAKGGCGLMVTGGISPNRAGGVGPFASKLNSIEEMEMHKIVTSSVHSVHVPSYSQEGESSEKARICLQILHAGRYAHHPFAVSASSTRSPISPFKARELRMSEISNTISDFVACAILAKEAGYDGVEIMGSEGYLINQFLVKATNFRNDKYGGEDFSNRMRFAVDIVRLTREAVGEDFIIIFRLSMLDLVKDGSSWEEIKILAQAIEAAGATIINTGIGWHQARVPTISTSVPRGAFTWVTKRLKDEGILSIPLCATNRINAPHIGEKTLKNFSADLVSMARPFLADSDIVKKSREGRFNEINTCIGCNQACLDHVFVGKTASCLVNPRACHETELTIKPNSLALEKRLTIGVVGSGPAGLAFATTAATIGHNVILYEKSYEIGGQFNMAKRIPGKEEFHETIRYFNELLLRLVREGKMEMKLGIEVKLSDMEDNTHIDKWVIATGVYPRAPSIPGIDHQNVLSYIDVLKNDHKVGKNVAIIGAGGIGFDVAEFLLHHNSNSNSVVTADDVDKDQFLYNWGVDKEHVNRGGLLSVENLSNQAEPKRTIFLAQRKIGKLGKKLGKTTGWIHRATLTKSKSVHLLDSVTYNKIDKNGHLHITSRKGDPLKSESRVLAVDNIIMCAGQFPKKDLVEKAALADFDKDIFTIGGAFEANELDAKRAIDMGTRLALKIDEKSLRQDFYDPDSAVSPEEKIFKLFKRFS